MRASVLTAALALIATAAPAAADINDRARFVAAGDIACAPGSTVTATQCQQKATSSLLRRLEPDAIATLGDNQYGVGAPEEFAGSFAPTWGRMLPIIHPAIGNHEYKTHAAAGYFGYFGAAAGQAGKGYYSYDVGSWHMIALNSNCSKVPCAQGSVQQQWLAADLAAHPVKCTLAYWHHPRFSSGPHGDTLQEDPLWQTLAAGGADVVLSGHDHLYERFGLIDGMREWVVGTGGRSHYPVETVHANSEVRNAETFGVLVLALRPTNYSWRFSHVGSSTFDDRGRTNCR